MVWADVKVALAAIEAELDQAGPLRIVAVETATPPLHDVHYGALSGAPIRFGTVNRVQLSDGTWRDL